jgi:predicted MFS family arabinose efflux permease
VHGGKIGSVEPLTSQQRLSRLFYEVGFALILAFVLLPVSGLPAYRAIALTLATGFAGFVCWLVWRASQADVPHPRLYAAASLSGAAFMLALAIGPFLGSPATGYELWSVVTLIAGLVAVCANTVLSMKSWPDS